jgi:hypothetical protein
MGYAKGEGASWAKGGRLFIECYPVAGFPLYDGFSSLGSDPKNRDMTWQGWEPRAADSLVAGISSTRRPAQLIIPTDTRTSFRVFRNYRLRWQLVAFQKRFRLLELPLPEIRPEFDRHTSNAGMLQSGMPHLARFQEFHRLSTRRHRVLLRQSGGLKRKIPGPSRASLLWLIFSPVAFVFSS